MSTKKQDKDIKQEVAEDVTFENQPVTDEEVKKEKTTEPVAGKERKKDKKSSSQKS